MADSQGDDRRLRWEIDVAGGPVRSLRGLLARGWVLAALIACALMQPTARLLARWDWRADLLTHFELPAWLATLAAFASACAAKRRRLAVPLALLAIGQTIPLLRYDLPASLLSPAAPAPARLRVLFANVFAYNESYERLFDLVEREDPDLIALVEFSEGWRSNLGPLRAAYPHCLERPNGTRGLALYAREPFQTRPPPEIVTPIEGGNPALAVTIERGGRSIDVWVLHPPNPIGPAGRSRGRAELERLAERIRQRSDERPLLVVGDLNRTSASPLLGDFERRTSLRDSRYGFGRQPSWPTWAPYRLTIDHAFVSPELVVLERRLGPNIGSDHFPLIVDVAVRDSIESDDSASFESAAEIQAGSSTPSETLESPSREPADSPSVENFKRSAAVSRATSRSTSSVPSRRSRASETAISSVVRAAQAGP